MIFDDDRYLASSKRKEREREKEGGCSWQELVVLVGHNYPFSGLTRGLCDRFAKLVYHT